MIDLNKDMKKLNEFYDWMKTIVETNVWQEDRLAAKERVIKNYEQQLLSPKTLYIVCLNYDEYRSFGYKNTDEVKYKFVYGLDCLRGTSNPNVKFVGRWIERPDINDIIMQVKVAKR